MAATREAGGTRPDGRDTGLAIDHVGIVVHDLAAEVAAWRSFGFAVSEPVPLMGRDPQGRPVPLGQSSAHVVFENGYVELSAPEPGSGNHLEPYLSAGEGLRILVLAAGDADAARRAVARRHPQVAPVATASREVVIEGAVLTARFRWFPLPVDVVPGVLSAVVQHETPGIVFHPSLVGHANGLTRMTSAVARGRCAGLNIPELPAAAATEAPHLALVERDDALRIDRLGFAGPGRGERLFDVGAG